MLMKMSKGKVVILTWLIVGTKRRQLKQQKHTDHNWQWQSTHTFLTSISEQKSSGQNLFWPKTPPSEQLKAIWSWCTLPQTVHLEVSKALKI